MILHFALTRTTMSKGCNLHLQHKYQQESTKEVPYNSSMTTRRNYFVAMVVAAAYAISLVNGFATPRLIAAAARRRCCDPASSQHYHDTCHNSFASAPLQHTINTSSSLNNSNRNNNLDNETTTTVGSKEYYQGFFTRSPNEEPVERVTGDAVLGPTLKFAGGVSLILVGLVFVFLASNGLL